MSVEEEGVMGSGGGYSTSFLYSSVTRAEETQTGEEAEYEHEHDRDRPKITSIKSILSR